MAATNPIGVSLRLESSWLEVDLVHWLKQGATLKKKTKHPQQAIMVGQVPSCMRSTQHTASPSPSVLVLECPASFDQHKTTSKSQKSQPQAIFDGPSTKQQRLSPLSNPSLFSSALHPSTSTGQPNETEEHTWRLRSRGEQGTLHKPLPKTASLLKRVATILQARVVEPPSQGNPCS
ncbi:hypothetical protein L7F22_021212 [Adiantum nelumboides]|nr:hypothetical protein [Adiantum nelumboides]